MFHVFRRQLLLLQKNYIFLLTIIIFPYMIAFVETEISLAGNLIAAIQMSFLDIECTCNWFRFFNMLIIKPSMSLTYFLLCSFAYKFIEKKFLLVFIYT